MAAGWLYSFARSIISEHVGHCFKEDACDSETGRLLISSYSLSFMLRPFRSNYPRWGDAPQHRTRLNAGRHFPKTSTFVPSDGNLFIKDRLSSRTIVMYVKNGDTVKHVNRKNTYTLTHSAEVTQVNIYLYIYSLYNSEVALWSKPALDFRFWDDQRSKSLQNLKHQHINHVCCLDTLDGWGW